MTKLKNMPAFWGIRLNTECPSCEEWFDILDFETDFWIDSNIEPLEHRTNQTKDYRVKCPSCKIEFLVDFEY